MVFHKNPRPLRNFLCGQLSLEGGGPIPVVIALIVANYVSSGRGRERWERVRFMFWVYVLWNRIITRRLFCTEDISDL